MRLDQRIVTGFLRHLAMRGVRLCSVKCELEPHDQARVVQDYIASRKKKDVA